MLLTLISTLNWDRKSGMLNTVQGIGGLHSVLDDRSGYPNEPMSCGLVTASNVVAQH